MKQWRDKRTLRRQPSPPPSFSSTGRARTASESLFFCQIEALETFIYLAEVAKKHGDTWIENDIRARQ